MFSSQLDHLQEKSFAESAIESIKDYAIFFLDPKGNILSWNKGGEILKGYTKEEILGKNFRVFYTEEDRGKNHPEQLLKAATDNDRVEEKGFRVHKDGHLFYADIVITALKENGVLKGFAKITRSLEKELQHEAGQDNLESAYKQIQELKKTKSNLEDALKKLKFTIKAAHMGTWELDLQSRKITIDEQVAEFFEIDLMSFEGNTNILFEKIHENDRDLVKSTILSANDNNKFFDIEFRVVRNGGKIIYLAVHGEVKKISPLNNKIFGFNWNITSRKELDLNKVEAIKQQELLERTLQAREFEKRRAQEAEAHRQRYSEYLDTMCHELRNPQNAILISVELISLYLIPELEDMIIKNLHHPCPENEEMIQKTFAEIKDILRILNTTVMEQKETINDLLDLSRTDNKKLQINIGPVKVNEIIEICRTIYYLQAKNKKLPLNVSIYNDISSNGDIYIQADREKLKRVISNLLSNAVKYTQSGSITVNVRLALENKESMLSVQIIDTGVGISKEMLPKIFDRFSTASISTSSSGLGLDLALSFVKIMGGKIDVISELGKGSVFTMKIPCEALSAQEIENFQQQEKEKKQKPVERHMKHAFRILITDDVEGNRKLLEKILKREGHQCETASDGDIAVEMANKNYYDFILMDFIMPKMNGDIATSLIRKNITSHRPFIIGLSANPTEDFQNRAKNAGMDLYLTKPVVRLSLFDAMTNLFESKRSHLNSASSSTVSKTFSTLFNKSPQRVNDLKAQLKLFFLSNPSIEITQKETTLIINLKNCQASDSSSNKVLLQDLLFHLSSYFKNVLHSCILNDADSIYLTFNSEENIPIAINVLNEIGLKSALCNREMLYFS